ncbi:hypothetical protein pdam_00020435, partial [Pocillopora damicornis]
KFNDRDAYYYTRRVKGAIHTRLHPDNINKDSGIEIPKAWMPTIKKHNKWRAVRQQTTGEKSPNTVSSPNRHKMTEMKSTSRATKPLFLKSAKESKSS